MGSPDDFIRMWREMAGTLKRITPGASELEVPAPIRQHLQLLDNAFHAQAAFQRELIERGLTPMREVLEGLEQAVESTRQAGAALRQAGELLEQQASIMEHAVGVTRPLRDMLEKIERGESDAR